jgi:hypothetical protein
MNLKYKSPMEFVREIASSVHTLLQSHWGGKFPKDQSLRELYKLWSGFAIFSLPLFIMFRKS